MAVKITVVLCAFAFLVQHAVNAGCGCGCGCGCGFGGGLGGIGSSGVSSSGGQFVVSSESSGSPGISVQSQNQYDGTLCLNGRLPFIGTVGIEGCQNSCGSGSVCYKCGDCSIGITERRCGCGCGCGGL